jgi:putative membrane-bound dehydrogenase-like protein
MIRAHICGLFLLLPIALSISSAEAAEPRLSRDQYHLELVAQEPEIVTPIAMAFDGAGRLLVVESHTHQRPEDYQGPTSDRLRMFADTDGDGKLDRWTTFAEGFRFAVGVLPRPDGAVYVIMRQSIALVKDTNGDGVADERRELVRLESPDEYPHNGLEGIALGPDGMLYFGLGENHGMAYTLTGSDGSQLKGKGGIDGIFRAAPDGGKIEHYASGFWNPFSICFDPTGRLFAADNDPDASPPCRLLHVVQDGDYGFLFQYGRAGTHPLQSWNGELPGALPMICGIGEAPTAIVPHAGRLWVTSWGDHRLEAYRLAPQGGSFGAEREVAVQGDTDFRPTGLAAAPDGSLYIGDWMLRDYPVHGRGRIWRLTLPKDELQNKFPPPSSDKPLPLTPLESKISHLQAERRKRLPDSTAVLREALADDAPDVRLYAVRWIADERIVALRDEVAKLLDGPLPNPRYYLAVLGAVDWLDQEFDPATTKGVSDALLVRELENSQRPPQVLALALQLLAPNNKYLTLDRLRGLLQQDYEPLRLEAVRTLAQQSNPKRFELLAATARDANQSDAVRAEAIVGLAAVAEKHRDVLEEFAGGANPVLAREAIRALRLAGLYPAAPETKPAPDDIAAWTALLAKPGDAASGRRLFFSAVGARCAVCHQFDGRGGTIGPDLTNVGNSNSRERIITSILQPSREIAPHFQSWLLTTTDGKTLSGLRLAKAGDDGVEPYADAEGREFTLKSEEIESRQASPASIMPDGLEATISIDDLRDLVTFLSAPGDASK